MIPASCLPKTLFTITFTAALSTSGGREQIKKLVFFYRKNQ